MWYKYSVHKSICQQHSNQLGRKQTKLEKEIWKIKRGLDVFFLRYSCANVQTIHHMTIMWIHMSMWMSYDIDHVDVLQH